MSGPTYSKELRLKVRDILGKVYVAARQNHSLTGTEISYSKTMMELIQAETQKAIETYKDKLIETIQDNYDLEYHIWNSDMQIGYDSAKDEAVATIKALAKEEK